MSEDRYTFADHLRPYVSLVLREHFESVGGRFTLGPSGQSVTGAAMERAAMLSQRSRTCPKCRGSKTQVIPVAAMKGKPARYIELECYVCCGAGELGEVRKSVPQTATIRCGTCKGAGYRQRREFVLAGQADPDPEPCPEEGCQRGYHWNLTALCGSGEYPHAAPTAGITRSPVTQALMRLASEGHDAPLLALEVAYGDVGRYVERELRAPLAVALWPLTLPGKRLMTALRLESGRHLHRALASALWSESADVSALAALANSSALAVLELSLSKLFHADKATGHRIRRAAACLERKDRKP